LLIHGLNVCSLCWVLQDFVRVLFGASIQFEAYLQQLNN
jgi:hypothetical protein